MATQSLKHAIYLARSGKSANLSAAYRRVDGIPAFGQLSYSDGGQLGNAYREIEGLLPGDRSYTTQEWIDATHDLVTDDPNGCDIWVSRNRTVQAVEQAHGGAWYVNDTRQGGHWCTYDRETAEEIRKSSHQASTAIAIATAEPKRGSWFVSRPREV